MRILAHDLQKHIGEKVKIQGWLHKKRLLGGLTFIVVRDRSGTMQALIKDKGEVEKLRGLQIGTVLQIDGVVAKDERAPGGVEVHEVGIKILVPIEFESPVEIDKPLSHESENLDTLFDHREIGLRNLREQAVFKIQSEVRSSIRNYLRKNDFTEISTPKLLAEPTEGGAEVFKMDYFGKVATLAQSAQFYKQMMVGVYERVYEIAATYRAEPSATTRHMTEFQTVDVELGFVDFEELLDLTGNLLNTVVDEAWSNCEGQLNMWGATKPVLPKEIPRLSMAEIHEKYSAATGEKTIGEKDLRPDEERWVCEYAAQNLGSEAVFVVDWPRHGAKFYHKFRDDNPEVAERADLIFRGIEIATVSMRENNYQKLVEQLKNMAGGDPEDEGFSHYLDAFKYGMPPEGGFGMGLERLTARLIGLANVKEASLFPRDINRLAP